MRELFVEKVIDTTGEFLDNNQRIKLKEILTEYRNGNKKSIEEVARAVIRGEYGNGQERKDKLRNIYNQVQARVNEILLGKNRWLNNGFIRKNSGNMVHIGAIHTTVRKL